MSRQNTMEAKIRGVLQRDEASRNSDIRLTQVYWWTHHKDLMQDADTKPYVYLGDLWKLPSQDGIKRVRAKIQNEKNEYLPTDPKVREKRSISEQEWRAYLGYDK